MSPVPGTATNMTERFLALLIEATAFIPDNYFHLPVAGKEKSNYRERVYCYEIYHQLRKLLDRDPDFAEYTLSGEIDKQGHPLIRKCAPDFVLHVPGEMHRNLAVLEVKPVNAALRGIDKDSKTLEYFLSPPIGYKLGVQLIYGDGPISLFTNPYEKKHLFGFQLLWHRRAGETAA